MHTVSTMHTVHTVQVVLRSGSGLSQGNIGSGATRRGNPSTKNPPPAVGSKTPTHRVAVTPPSGRQVECAPAGSGFPPALQHAANGEWFPSPNATRGIQGVISLPVNVGNRMK